MLTLLLTALVLAFTLTVFLIPQVIEVANARALYDLPDERKKHARPIPALGGLGVFLSFMLTVIALARLEWWGDFRFVALGAVLLVFVGLKDDLLGVSPVKRLLLQLGLAALFYGAGLRLEGLYGLFGVEALPAFLNFPLTVLAVGLIVNAYNLIDGINGLAGSLGTLGSLVFGSLFYIHGLQAWSFLAFAFAGAMLGFLKYNYGRGASTFMGDNGSLLLGWLMALFFVKFTDTAYRDWAQPHALVLGLSVIAIPVFDLLRLFLVRLLKRVSPFSADRNHIHHLVLRTGRNHPEACLRILLINGVLMLTAATWAAGKPVWLGLVVLFLLFIAGLFAISLSQSISMIKKVEWERHRIGPEMNFQE